MQQQAVSSTWKEAGAGGQGQGDMLLCGAAAAAVLRARTRMYRPPLATSTSCTRWMRHCRSTRPPSTPPSLAAAPAPPPPPSSATRHSCLSWEPVTRRRPSGIQAAQVTGSVWCRSQARQSPLAVSHTRSPSVPAIAAGVWGTTEDLWKGSGWDPRGSESVDPTGCR